MILHIANGTEYQVSVNFGSTDLNSRNYSKDHGSLGMLMINTKQLL